MSTRPTMRKPLKVAACFMRRLPPKPEQSCHLRAHSGAIVALRTRRGVIRQLRLSFSHGFSFHHIHGYVRPEREFEAPSHTEYDLLYQWRTPWDGRITMGVINLTDEDPELDPHVSQRPALYSLYSLDGRQPYLGYRHSF